jgi:hypothetical protein
MGEKLTSRVQHRHLIGQGGEEPQPEGSPMTGTEDSAADQAREKTQKVGAQARDRVRAQVDQRSTQAGEQAGSAAQALREASQKLRQDGNEPVAKGMERVADRVESAGGWLRDSDGDAILRDVEDFGRRNPLAVMAGGLALGFAASRLLKASSRRRYEPSSASNGSTAPPPPGVVDVPNGGGATDAGLVTSAPPHREGLTTR